MLKKKKQHRYLDKRWKAAKAHLYAFAGAGSPDALHRLRVELKKIKAYLQFMQAVTGRAPQPAVMKKIFRTAGGIRDAQIALKLMQQYHVKDDTFRSAEIQLQQEQTGRLRTHAAKYAKQLRKARKQMPVRPIRNRLIKRWMLHQLQRIAYILHAGQYHPARKQIKTLLYIHELLPARLQAQLTLDAGYLDQLQDRIGNWHDASLFLSQVHQPAPKDNVTELAENFPDKVFHLK